MTPQERDLIDSVFERLAQHAPAKDADALARIREHLQRNPDAVYGLVQAVIVQEMSLQQAGAHIAELERQLTHGAGQSSGGFLSGLNPFARAPRPSAPVPAAPWTQAPQPQAGPWGQSQGGSFLGNVATMAAGVAGGTLLADGIASLFGGRHLWGGGFGPVGGFGGPWGGGDTIENVTVNNYGADPSRDVPQDAGLQNDGGYQDASFDDSSGGDAGFDSGFDSGGFDSGSTDI